MRFIKQTFNCGGRVVEGNTDTNSSANHRAGQFVRISFVLQLGLRKKDNVFNSISCNFMRCHGIAIENDPFIDVLPMELDGSQELC